MSHVPIKLNGRIDDIDLEDIVTNTREDVLTLTNKIFNNNVSIDGNLVFDDLVSGVNMSKLCTFTNEKDFPSRLVLNGKSIVLI